MAAGRLVTASKVCAWPRVGEANKRIKEGWNAAQLNGWSKPLGLSCNRQTWYSHKAHITSGQDKLVTYVERALANPVIQNTTSDDFLKAVQKVGMQRVVDDPESVTIDHALKATQILEQAKERVGDIHLVLAKVFMGVTDNG